VRLLGHREFETTITREVIDQCPDFQRWMVRTVPAGNAGGAYAAPGAVLAAVYYDPY
jgi:hypothetical protein